MTFNVWTFLFEAINFVVLVYVLKRLLYGPLREAIDRRREATERARSDADKARLEAESLQGRLRAELADLDHRREEAVRAAREQAEADGRKLLAAAEEAARRREDEASKAIGRERDEAHKALREEVVGQALDLARRLLHESAERTLHQQLALHLAETVKATPEAERQQLRGHWGPDDTALLQAAGELDDPTVAEVREAVAAIAGRAVPLTVEAKPELLGGVRLRVGGQVWDGSLAGQLQDAAREGATP